MRLIFCLVSTLLLVSCAGSSGGGSSAGSTVTGLDYSGSYVGDEIECYNASLTTLTTQAAITTGIDYITITGNSYTAQTNDFGCAVSYSGNIVFTASGVSLSNRRVTSASGGSCTSQFALSNSPAHTVTPTTLSTAHATGDTLPNVTNAPYIRAVNGNTGLLSVLSNSVAASDICLIVYKKQ